MRTINEHIKALEHEIYLLNCGNHVTEADEFIAVHEIELALHKAKEIFQRTKDIDKEN